MDTSVQIFSSAVSKIFRYWHVKYFCTDNVTKYVTKYQQRVTTCPGLHSELNSEITVIQGRIKALRGPRPKIYMSYTKRYITSYIK